jgi:hypothetical protein
LKRREHLFHEGHRQASSPFAELQRLASIQVQQNRILTHHSVIGDYYYIDYGGSARKIVP